MKGIYHSSAFKDFPHSGLVSMTDPRPGFAEVES